MGVLLRADTVDLAGRALVDRVEQAPVEGLAFMTGAGSERSLRDVGALDAEALCTEARDADATPEPSAAPPFVPCLDLYTEKVWVNGGSAFDPEEEENDGAFAE